MILNSANALSSGNAALQASLASGLGANLATSSLLSSSLTNELASNLSSFGVNSGVNSLTSLQASLANAQNNSNFAAQRLSKLDNEVAFSNNSSFVGSAFNNRDFDGSFNRGDVDRNVNSAAFSTNTGQLTNRQNVNGSRPVSDSILIGNVC